MAEPTVTFSEYLEDIYDEDGNLVEADVPHLCGQIDATDELGCFVVYITMMPKQAPDSPQRMEMLRKLVREGCLRELDRVRVAHASSGA